MEKEINMEIRRSTNADLSVILELYAHAREFMRSHGNPEQWGSTYPPQELVEADIHSGCSYVCVEQGRIVGTFYYSTEPESDYEKINDGKWLNDAPYGVVHRITSDGTVKGTASYCLDWALQQCGNLKIDTHRDNTVMQHTLSRNGFQYCGIVFIKDGSERLAYQKHMPKK